MVGASDQDGGDKPAFPVRAVRSLRASTAAHPVLAALLAISTVGAAAIVVTYTTDSTVQTQTTDPPVQLATGGDTGSTSDYVTAFSLSTNNTYLTSTVKGVPEANLTIDSYFKIENVDDTSRSVTLSTAQVTDTDVTDYSILVLDGSTVKGHLDLEAASPSTTFTLPASTTYDAKLHLELASGTTDADLGGGLSTTISLSVS